MARTAEALHDALPPPHSLLHSDRGPRDGSAAAGGGTLTRGSGAATAAGGGRRGCAAARRRPANLDHLLILVLGPLLPLIRPLFSTLLLLLLLRPAIHARQRRRDAPQRAPRRGRPRAEAQEGVGYANRGQREVLPRVLRDKTRDAEMGARFQQRERIEVRRRVDVAFCPGRNEMA